MSYHHLSAAERKTIMYCSQYGLSLREIGRRLRRSHTTISRELKRNQRVCGGYWDEAAEYFATVRRHTPRPAKRRDCRPLYDYVERRLKRRWSPETICGRLSTDYPALQLSPECIYQWVFENAKSGGNWYTYLARHHKRRKPQCRAARACRGVIKNRVDISERPSIVESRGRIGDWEGDTIAGRQGTGLIATYVERKTGKLIATKLDTKRADELALRSAEIFQLIPKAQRVTLTCDNGKEFANHQKLSHLTGLDIYFAKPYSPWQRGCNENINGLLRQYFPKGSDFSKVTDEQLDQVVKSLNNRPRKRFNYRTPNEMCA